MNQRSNLKRLVVLALVLVVTPAPAQEHDNGVPDSGDRRLQFLVLGPIAAPRDGDEADPIEIRKTALEADLIAPAGELLAMEPKAGQTVEIGGKEYTWTEASTTEGPAVDLDTVLGRHEWSVAYAHLELDSHHDDETLLGIGSDDAVRVWLNGELVHSKWIGRPLRIDEDLVPVKLREGKNRLLIKIVNWTLDWGFSCRVVPRQALTERLARAILRGDRETVKTLLGQGVAADVDTKLGAKPVQLAKIHGDPVTLKLLLDAGAQDLPPPDPAVIAKAMFTSQPIKQLPGLSVMVARDGEVIFERAIGLADISNQRPVTTKSKFRIGSVTKQFTAAAILKLVEEGKLSVTDTLDQFLPDFPRGKDVTIHHLLTHTSGIPSYTDDPNFYEAVTEPTTEPDLIATFAGKEFSFEPGSQFHYNNSGYFLLGHIVRKVTGQSLGDYLQATFFDPIGMTDTGMHTLDVELTDEAKGYAVQSGKADEALNWAMSRAGGAGALYSTVHDLVKWNEAVFNGRVLKEETLNKAFTPVEPSGGGMTYGYGWMIGRQRGLPTIHHGGGLHGFQSNLIRFPDQKLTIVALHNASPAVADLAPGNVTNKLAELFLWNEMEPRPLRQVDPDVDPALYDRYVGRYDYGASAVLMVTKESNRLFAQLTGQPKFEIYPASETGFFWKVAEASVEFVLDDDGNCVAARHSQGPANFEAKKLQDSKDITLAAEQLKAFVGVYDYKQAKMTVTRKGTQLVAQMEGQPALAIYPQGNDVFIWKVVAAEIAFVRDQDGKVTGAIHSQGGSKFEVKKIE